MLTAVVSGLLCGNRGDKAIAEWLHDLPVDVWHWMGYTRRPPQQDCFRDLLMKLDPVVLEDVLTTWISEALKLDLPTPEVAGISIDGKQVRSPTNEGGERTDAVARGCGTLRPFARAVHLVSLVDHQTGCVLSQCRVDEKTNEHKAALNLLKTIVLKGRVIVGDAMFCQRDLCQQIVDSGCDYFITVKDNQPTLLREIELELAADGAAPAWRNTGPLCTAGA